MDDLHRIDIQSPVDPANTPHREPSPIPLEQRYEQLCAYCNELETRVAMLERVFAPALQQVFGTGKDSPAGVCHPVHAVYIHILTTLREQGPLPRMSIWERLPEDLRGVVRAVAPNPGPAEVRTHVDAKRLSVVLRRLDHHGMARYEKTWAGWVWVRDWGVDCG